MMGQWQTSGALVVDFFGGTPGFVTGTVMGLPRLLYAFGRLERGGTAVEVGQDHVMLAPRDPTSLASFAFPQFFRAGNLYLRAPQVRLEQRVGGFTVKGGIVAPVVGDAGTSYVFAPGAGAGERSERPALQGHVGYGRGDAGRCRRGAGRRLGPLRLDPLVRPAHPDLGRRRRPRPAPRPRWRGRRGSTSPMNLMPTASGVGQPGRSTGGWVEGRLAAASRVSLNGGGGLDRRPDGIGAAGRLRNTSAFGNVIVRLTPGGVGVGRVQVVADALRCRAQPREPSRECGVRRHVLTARELVIRCERGSGKRHCLRRAWRRLPALALGVLALPAVAFGDVLTGTVTTRCARARRRRRWSFTPSRSSGSAPTQGRESVSLSQRDKRFSPRVLGVPVGSPVRVPERRRHLPQRLLALARARLRPRLVPGGRVEEPDVRLPGRRAGLLQHPSADDGAAGRGADAVDRDSRMPAAPGVSTCRRAATP